MIACSTSFLFFFFNDTATTEIYTLSLHDALPISRDVGWGTPDPDFGDGVLDSRKARLIDVLDEDRKSTRLNSSHQIISYAVFCLKKKKNKDATTPCGVARQRC